LQLGQFLVFVEMKAPQLQQTTLALQLGHCLAPGTTKWPQLQQDGKHNFIWSAWI
jgi:hypothetical protein